MVFMPPGSAKSTYVSQRFPAFYMGRFPGRKVILASYAKSLASVMGRKTRSIIGGPEYQRLFPEAGMSPDTRAKTDFTLLNDSEYFAVGVDAGVTGHRSDLQIWDDLIKGRKEADSPVVREGTWGWLQAEAMTRLKPDASIVFVMTRWHEDDPAGRILPRSVTGESLWHGESGWIDCGDGEKWYVLCLPAEAVENDPLGREPGDPLWPEYWTGDFLKKARGAAGARNWAALYQQQPAPEEGTFFNRKWFKWYDPWKAPDEAPGPMHYYGSSDYAVSEDEGDWTELGVHGVDQKGNIYVNCGGWSGQTAPDKWIDAELDLIDHWQPLMWVGEGGVIRKSVEPFQAKQGDERGIYCRREWLSPIGDKAYRARAFQARCSAGKVYLPKNQDGFRILQHLLAFPAGNLDHTVDMLGLMGRALDELVSASPDSEPRKKRRRAAYEPHSAVKGMKVA